MKIFRLTTFILAIAFSCFDQLPAQNTILPMDIPPYLSANFGELRGNHFHSGLDFKTEGRTGIPVKAVKDGYISRIFVSPWGFGQALYVNHPDGTMTVYGHLERFAKRIESIARDSQYVKESFSIDIHLPTTLIPVKQGEVIAYSGNAGSSGGPHLHFEIRNQSGDEIMDPLPVYMKQIQDNRPPEIRSLMFFPQQGKGIVNDKTQDQVFLLTKDKSGKQALDKTVYAWGEIGVGIKAYDRMTGTDNVYTPKEIILKVDNKVVFHSKFDHFSFSESRYINSFISWEDWADNNSLYIKSFIDPGNRLNVYKISDSGMIVINEERAYHFEYTLLDTHGNKTTFAFDVNGQKKSIPSPKVSGQLFLYNNDNAFSSKGVELNIPRGNLYKNRYFRVDTINRYTPFAPLYQLREKAPLHTPCSLALKITNDTYSDKTKYGVVSVKKGKESWVGGTYENAKIRVPIKETGDYAIRIDTVPPALTPVTPAKWEVSGKISFKVQDNASGVTSWRGTINGKFVLFEYDPKNNALFYVSDYTRVKKGISKLELKVTDGCGNETFYTSKIAF